MRVGAVCINESQLERNLELIPSRANSIRFHFLPPENPDHLDVRGVGEEVEGLDDLRPVFVQEAFGFRDK